MKKTLLTVESVNAKLMLVQKTRFKAFDGYRDPKVGRFVCACGNVAEKIVWNVLSGLTKSCGCMKKGPKTREPFTFFSWAESGAPSKEAYVRMQKRWNCIKQRCRNPKNRHYKNYGGRGIDMCDEWHSSFIRFISDMGWPKDESLTIERKDNDVGYYPSNCVWATRKVQANNRRKKSF